MKVIFSTVVGSKLHGTDGPDSDTDLRQVHVTDLATVLFGKAEKVVEAKTYGREDVSYELVHFLRLLRSGALQTLEMIHSKPEAVSQRFLPVLTFWKKLVNSSQVADQFVGYSRGEIARTFGEGSGSHKLGDARKSAIAEYGFSPKNAAHALRLALTGAAFFQTGIYSPRLNEDALDLVSRVKWSPETFAPEAIRVMLTDAMTRLVECIALSTVSMHFDAVLATDIIILNYAVDEIRADQAQALLNPLPKAALPFSAEV